MIQSKIIIAILAAVVVVAVGVTVVVKVVAGNDKTAEAVTAPAAPSAPDSGRGQPHGKVENSPSKGF